MSTSVFRRARTTEQLRFQIFMSWFGFAVLMTCAPPLLLLHPRLVDVGIVLDLMKTLVGLWAPVLACFGGFWFSARQYTGSPSRVSRNQVVSALGLTALYLAICTLAVMLVLFVSDYSAPLDTNELAGPTMKSQLTEAIGWLQLISPLFLAPIGFLTGKVPDAGNR